MAEIDVYLNNQLNGRLAKQSDKAVFNFALNAKEALSLTMPIRTESPKQYPNLNSILSSQYVWIFK
mgnify:CR=1 FL=1